MNAMHIVMIIGVIITAMGLWLGHRQIQFIREGRAVEGLVVDLIPHPSSKGGTTYSPKVKFRTSEGRDIEYTTPFSLSTPGVKTGERIKMVYQERRPEKAGILSFGYRFGVSWCLLCAGTAMIVLSLGFIYGPAWMESLVRK